MVDDHPINRYVLSRQLSLLGYTYVTAEDGLQALEMSRKHKLALLITDCQMPGMDGYQLARSIREDEAKSGRAALPILACTASALQGEAEKCAAAGMSDYMTKPLQVPVLAGMLKKWGPNMQALATPSTATELPIDTQYWERQTAGDEELKAMLADQFIATSQTDLEALHDMALNNQDVARAQAHRIKGAAVAVGARQLGRLCEELEAAFTQHNQAETKRLIAALDAEMNAVVSWLGKQTHQPAHRHRHRYRQAIKPDDRPRSALAVQPLGRPIAQQWRTTAQKQKPFAALPTTSWTCWHSMWPRRLIATVRPRQFPGPGQRSA
jgi:CheY-like chemotaxis protein